MPDSPVITRAQYLADPNTLHQAFYAQFVTRYILDYVGRWIGRDAILQSTDEAFNDIPLEKFDKLNFAIREGIDHNLWRAAMEWPSQHTLPWALSDGVCIAKAAARIIKETAEQEEASHE